MKMHVISKKPFILALRKYPKYSTAIIQTYDLLKKVECKTPLELKTVINTLDNFKYKDKWYVIDIAGNNLRVMVFIEFRARKMFVKHIVNHAEYDKLCERYAKGEL
jgi:mRNA interferase HigB